MSRNESLCYPACRKRRLMEASRGLPARAIPSTILLPTGDIPLTVVGASICPSGARNLGLYFREFLKEFLLGAH